MIKHYAAALFLTLSTLGVSHGSGDLDITFIPDAHNGQHDTFFKNHAWVRHKHIVADQYGKLSDALKEQLSNLPEIQPKSVMSPYDIAQDVFKHVPYTPTELYTSGIVRLCNIVDTANLAQQIVSHYGIKDVYLLGNHVGSKATGWVNSDHLNYVYPGASYNLESSKTILHDILGHDVTVHDIALEDGKWGLQQWARTVKKHAQPGSIILGTNDVVTRKNLSEASVDISQFTLVCTEADEARFSKSAEFEYTQLGDYTEHDLKNLLNLDHILEQAANKWRETSK